MDIDSLQPLNLAKDLLLIWDGIFPIDVFGVQGSYLGYVSAWDDLEQCRIATTEDKTYAPSIYT